MTGTWFWSATGYVAIEAPEVAGPTSKATPSSVINFVAAEVASLASPLLSILTALILYFESLFALYSLIASVAPLYSAWP